MAAPVITYISATASRISAINGKDTCDVVFQSDQGLREWEARADGGGIRQGMLVGFSSITTWDQVDGLVLSFDYAEMLQMRWDELDTLKEYDDLETLTFANADSVKWDSIEGMEVLTAATNETFRIDNEELLGGDKAYRINIYGKNAAGEWTGYG